MGSSQGDAVKTEQKIGNAAVQARFVEQKDQWSSLTTTGQRWGRQGKQSLHLLYRPVHTHAEICGVNSEAQVEKTAVHKTKQNNKQNAPEQPMASASRILPSWHPATAANGGMVTSLRLYWHGKIPLGQEI
jgi:hypothetical protein